MKLITIDKPEIGKININEQLQYLKHLKKSKPVKYKPRDRSISVLRSTYLIIGLGSMGKRRIRCLLSIGIESSKIFGFDIRRDRLEESILKFNIKELHQINEYNISFFSGVFICTPPDHHIEYAEIAVAAEIDIFLEASVIKEGLDLINTIAEDKSIIVFPSCTMRYFEGPINLKRIVNSNIVGFPLCWQYQSGQYLLDWHPWESIDSYYVSQKETGGCREIVPFELSWIVDIFGNIAEVFSCMHKVSAIQADIDDIYQINVKHSAGVVGQMTVEVLSRSATRYIRVVCTEGTIVWDDSSKEVVIYHKKDNLTEIIKLEFNNVEIGYVNSDNPYINETMDFISCIKSRKQPTYTLADDIKILDYLNKIESSAMYKKRIEI